MSFTGRGKEELLVFCVMLSHTPHTHTPIYQYIHIYVCVYWTHMYIHVRTRTHTCIYELKLTVVMSGGTLNGEWDRWPSNSLLCLKPLPRKHRQNGRLYFWLSIKNITVIKPYLYSSSTQLCRLYYDNPDWSSFWFALSLLFILVGRLMNRMLG